MLCCSALVLELHGCGESVSSDSIPELDAHFGEMDGSVDAEAEMLLTAHATRRRSDGRSAWRSGLSTGVL